MTNKNSKTTTLEMMKDFKKIIMDMTRDILITFPELNEGLDVRLKNVLNDTDVDGQALEFVFLHCKKVYPDKFFDILYQNNTIFEKSIEFLPGIDFEILWKDTELSVKSRETIWKYLQLVLFTIVSTISDGSSFGDSAKLFEAINEDEFKKKLEETIAQMQDVFKNASGDASAADASGHAYASGDSASANGDDNMPNINLEDLPNPQDIHDHVTSMMEGKLGKLAREIAEETATDLNIDMENADSVNDVFKRLFKNPTKLMSLVKNVGSKLDEKLKSGDIKESELLKEASDIMQQMKNMPGMNNLQNMMKKMGMGDMAASMAGMASGGKMNMGAMQANIDRNLKNAQHKDRLRAKLSAKQAQQQQAQQQQAQQQQSQQQQSQQAPQQQQSPQNLVFSTGEVVERSLKKKKKKKNNNDKKE
jgi:hypothetical protein